MLSMPILNTLKNYVQIFSQLIYPHYCQGCGSDVLSKDNLLCTLCQPLLPVTFFTANENNIVEKKFYGRLAVEAATAGFHFTKDGLMQHLVFQLKYKNNQQAGFYLGKLMGYQLLETNRFSDVDVLIPLPLNKKKEKQRGYNQATIICNGIASVWPKPVLTNGVERVIFTKTQTHENRLSRWQNMQGVFSVTNPQLFNNKHVALVDDVITTGATLEACGETILKNTNAKLSIICVANTL